MDFNTKKKQEILIWKGEFRDGREFTGEGICKIKLGKKEFIYQGYLEDFLPNGYGERINSDYFVIWSGVWQKGIEYSGDGICDVQSEGSSPFCFKGEKNIFLTLFINLSNYWKI